jgi:hypothetical protein
MGDPVVSRAIATADVDGDGDLDVAIANQWEQSYFYRNDSINHNQFLGLRLQHSSGSPVIGAVATVVKPDGQTLVAQVDGGNGHSGVRSSDLHFGLGLVPNGEAVSVHLGWRDHSGVPHEADLQMLPGWHTLELGDETIQKHATSLDSVNVPPKTIS